MANKQIRLVFSMDHGSSKWKMLSIPDLTVLATWSDRSVFHAVVSRLLDDVDFRLYGIGPLPYQGGLYGEIDEATVETISSLSRLAKRVRLMANIADLKVLTPKAIRAEIIKEGVHELVGK